MIPLGNSLNAETDQTGFCRMYMIRIKTDPTSPVLIAPCGINCRLCRAYIRDKNACPGCRGEDTFKSKSCVMCKIRNCEKLVTGGMKYCFDCDEFPCGRLTHLDKRYRARYGTSPIDNLTSIREIGIRNFVENENKKWICPECGAMLCMHQPQCLSCGYMWLKKIDTKQFRSGK
jgi:hypothetical protein